MDCVFRPNLSSSVCCLSETAESGLIRAQALTAMSWDRNCNTNSHLPAGDRTTFAAIVGGFVAAGVLLFLVGLYFVTSDGSFAFNKGSYQGGRPTSSGPVWGWRLKKTIHTTWRCLFSHFDCVEKHAASDSCLLKVQAVPMACCLHCCLNVFGPCCLPLINCDAYVLNMLTTMLKRINSRGQSPELPFFYPALHMCANVDIFANPLRDWGA